MPKLDLSSIAARRGTNYPADYGIEPGPRMRQRLGDAGGLTQFGVNRLELPSGSWSSQRHWHSVEDEFVCVLAGEVVLVTDDGEAILKAGDCAAFPANTPNGHHLINRSGSMAICLEVGGRSELDRVVYPDIDLLCEPGVAGYLHRNGTPYPPQD
ncbi:cupin domain-containing protein [Massilia sp. S19_KUP03_FR1]|uniref:cupin domain-containing protein n=1 Tax=Massilia sp. S19_KUP03_FR1 TaxID=3025503 RepID=UPI002FCD96C6